jgi:hypothetical protein
MHKRLGTALILGSLLLATCLAASPDEARPQDPKQDFDKKGFGKKGGPFGPGGPGGFGGPFGQQQKLVKQFDKDGDGRLNAEERKAAREFLRKQGGGFGGKGFGPGGKGKGKGPGGFGPGGPPQPGQILPEFLQGSLNLTADQKKQVADLQKEVDAGLSKLLTAEQKKTLQQMREMKGPLGGFGPPGKGGPRDPAKPGPRVAPADVKSYPDVPLYEPTILRTLFLEFESTDWEEELADFRNTDVLVPATLTVDGKKYPNVGVHYRGMSSYFMVPAGYKRSLNLSLDFADKKQRLQGYKTLNLLNAADDPTFMHTVLFSHVARQYIPSPKANLVKVVINGESWGVYANAQQFNKDFLRENFHTTQGARWKVKGNPGADGGLRYLGDNVEEYKRRFTLKSKENARDWQNLIDLCRTLNETPLDKVEKALEPILDIDGVLWFLALDVAVQNDDGYWTRASDYSLYRDPKGKFHLIPHDTNETFAPVMGFGFGKGPKGGFGKGKGGPGAGGKASGYDLDPLVGLDNPRMPLRSRLLAVPGLRQRYLQHVRTIAEKSFDWKQLGPVVERYRALIEKEVEIDTRKLYSLEEFKNSLDADGGSRHNLRTFAEQRRNYLLNHAEVKKTTSPK